MLLARRFRSALGLRCALPVRWLAVETVAMPKMDADSIDSGTVLAIHAKVGQAVAEDDLLAEVETDKVTVEVRATVSGAVTEVLVQEEEDVAIAAPMFKIDTEQEGEASSGGGGGGTGSEEGSGDGGKVEVASSAPAPPKPTPTPQTPPKTHATGRAHTPLIQFRHGKANREAVEKRGGGEVAAGRWEPPKSTATIDFFDLPPKYARPTLTEEEIEAINTGGV